MCQLTERDSELIRWINRFGVVTIHHIAQHWGVANTTAYARCRQLSVNGYLHHERYFVNQPGVYRASSKGVAVSNSQLPSLRQVNVATLQHDLMVVSVCQHLVKQYNSQLITERELRQAEGKLAFGHREHIADGQIIINHKRIALEVELSKKGHKRLEGILKNYMKNIDIHQVWYFINEGPVKRHLEGYRDKGYPLIIHALPGDNAS